MLYDAPHHAFRDPERECRLQWRPHLAREPPLGLEQRRLGEDGAEDNRTLLLAQHARLVAGLEEALKRRGVGQRVGSARAPPVCPSIGPARSGPGPPGTHNRGSHGHILLGSVSLRTSLLSRAGWERLRHRAMGGAPPYSSSLTCSLQVAALPSSSTSTI